MTTNIFEKTNDINNANDIDNIDDLFLFRTLSRKNTIFEEKEIILQDNKEEFKEQINDFSIKEIKETDKNIENFEINKICKIFEENNIELNKEYIDILIKIVDSNSTFLDDIKKTFINVVKDNKIDSNDLPYLISIIEKLYESIYINKYIKIDKKKIPVVCSYLVKFIYRYFILDTRSRIIDNNVFLELFDKLVDSCVGLLSFPKSIKLKNKNKYFNYFSYFFQKK
jgi:hypothetical protein